MEQEIVIEVPLHEEKNKSKAMKKASKMNGVTKVEAVRERNLLVVTGNRVDSVELARSLRKIFCFAHIRSVRDLTVPETPEAPEPEPPTEEPDSTQHVFQNQATYNYPTPSYYQPPPFNYVAIPVHDPDPPRICSIM